MPAKLKLLEQFEVASDITIPKREPIATAFKHKQIAKAKGQLPPAWCIKSAPFSSLEATLGSFYNLMLNDSAAKCRPVKDSKSDKPKFHASKVLRFTRLPNSGTEYWPAIPSEGKLPEIRPRAYGAEFTCTKEYAESLAAVLVSLYVFEENDAASRNLGYAKGKIYKIDSGESLWPITCRYQNVPTRPDHGSRAHPIAPKEAFNITQRDLLDFPLHKGSDAKPFLTVLVHFSDDKVKAEFTRHKWKYFLKALLIGNDMLKKTADQFMTDSDPIKKEVLDHMQARLKILETTLLSTLEFNQAVTDNLSSFKSDIFKEFAEYNAMKKPKDPVQFNFENIESNWNRITTHCVAQLVIQSVDYRYSRIVLLTQFLNSECSRFGSDKHEKISRMRKNRAELQSLTKSMQADNHISVTCDVIKQLETHAAIKRGCCFGKPKTQLHWEAFKQANALWLRAFHNANITKVRTEGHSSSPLVFRDATGNDPKKPLLGAGQSYTYS
ncbi:MAG: hypothetical protein K0Q57_1133 [Gammaproteobacteria bacterium]|nr:hypothetical protein [Gammaproteobacteria bacterium]